MTLERRTQALLELVEADRHARCSAIADDAHERATTLVRQAHAEARTQMRDAFTEERSRAAQRLAAARAHLATRRRHAEQQRAAALLAVGLARLPDELRRQWAMADTRARWIDAALDSALAVLPRTPWRIEHPDDFGHDEREAITARLVSAQHAAPGFAAEARLAAGLRISANGIVVDGSLTGVIADRSAIGARLLGLLEAVR